MSRKQLAMRALFTRTHGHRVIGAIVHPGGVKRNNRPFDSAPNRPPVSSSCISRGSTEAGVNNQRPTRGQTDRQ